MKKLSTRRGEVTHLQETVKQFMIERDWLNQPPEDIAKSIVIEAAELLEHFQWTNFFKTAELDPETKKEVIDELADVFIYAIEMSIRLNCDITQIVEVKLAKAAIKYPVKETMVLGSSQYKAIKKQYRKSRAS